MLIDFLLNLYGSMLDFLNSSLPLAGSNSGVVPQPVLDVLGNIFYYIDVSPFKIFINLMFSLLVGFVIYKVITLVFSWIRG